MVHKESKGNRIESPFFSNSHCSLLLLFILFLFHFLSSLEKNMLKHI